MELLGKTGDLTNVLSFEIKNLNIKVQEAVEQSKKLDSEHQQEVQTVEGAHKKDKQQLETILAQTKDQVLLECINDSLRRS